jgi:hypothetical protein
MAAPQEPVRPDTPEGHASSEEPADGEAPHRRATAGAVAMAEASLQKLRSWTGLLVVIGGDVTIAVAAIVGVRLASGKGSEALVAILTSAFTAISSMTSAYFGIRAASNTAQSSVNASARTNP